MKLLLRSILFVVIASLSTSVEAQQNTIWYNNGNTSFEDTANWNNGFPSTTVSAYVVPNGVAETNGTFFVTPGGSSNIVINAADNESAAGFFVNNDNTNSLPVGTATLTFASGTTFNVVGDMGVSDGESFTFSGDATVGGSVVVSDTASFILSSGTLDNSAGNSIFIGDTNGDTASFTQNSSSVVLAGAEVEIGAGGNGSYTLNDTSALETSAGAGTSIIVGGSGTGTLTLNDSSSLDVNDGTSLTIDNGTVTQTGSGTTVTFSGDGSMIVGGEAATTGSYVLQNGAFNLGANSSDTAIAVIGDSGTGAFVQTGGTLTTQASTIFDVGTAGTGTFTMTGGTASFNGALVLGANGTINVNGGTLAVLEGNLTGTGTLNLGGGTLALVDTASSNVTNYTYGFAGNLTGGTSTIDVSGATHMATFTFANGLTQTGTGNAGLNLVGDGSTIFNFADIGAGSANTYTGSTGIFNGVLNATGLDLEAASAAAGLNIGSGAQLNLALGTGTTTLRQSILGSGIFDANFAAGGGTLVLSNTNNSASSVNIDLGANGVGTGTLQVYSGSYGTISQGSLGNSVVIGTPGGSGGSVTFGATSYNGSTMVNSGYSLNAQNLDGDVVNDGLLTVAGAIGSSNANTVTNAGTLTAGSIAGDVSSNSGSMTVSGSGIAGNVDANTGLITSTLVGGTLNNAGTYVASGALGSTSVVGDVTNTGTLASSATLPEVATPTQATFTTSGTLDSTGTLTIRTNGIAADEYVAGAGASTISGALKLSGYANNVYTIFDTSGTLTSGAISVLQTTLFKGSVAQVGNTLVLTTTQIPSTTFSKTPTQYNVAATLDKFLGTAGALSGYSSQVQNEFNAFNNVYSNLQPSQYAAIQESLTPTALQYARDIAFENTTYLAQRMNGVDADLRNGYQGLDTSAVSITTPGFSSGTGRSLGSLLAANDPSFHSSAPNGVNYYPGESGRNSPSPSEQDQVAPTFDSSNQVISDSPNPYLANVKPGSPGSPRLSEFIGGDVILADLNKDGTLANAPSSKGNYTAGGATAGVSFRVTNHFAAGVLFDYNHTDANLDSLGSKMTVDSYSPGVYATYFDHGFYANGLFSFGYNNYTNKLSIPAFGETAISTPNGEQYVGDLDVGYDFHPDKAWVAGPTLGATYTHLDIDSAQETGAGLQDLSINSQSVDSVRSRLGGHVLYQTYTGDVLLQPSLIAMWQHEYLDNADNLTSNFSELGGSSTFITPTAAPNRDSALIGLGLTATLNNSMALYLNYLADFGDSDFFSQSVIGGFKARF